MDDIVKFLGTSEWFVALVNITSLIGFLLTIWVLFDVRNIKSYYVFKVRVPQHVKKLKKYAANLSEYMNDFEGMLPQVEMELASIEVELESLRRKLDRKPGRPVDQLLRDVKAYNKAQTKDIKALRRIHIDLHKAVTRIEEIQEDLRWES
jgi:hypothetical protein